jgi:hypothetical protein
VSQTNKALKFAPSTSKMGATAPCALGRCHGKADELRVRHPTVEPEVARVAESDWAINHPLPGFKLCIYHILAALQNARADHRPRGATFRGPPARGSRAPFIARRASRLQGGRRQIGGGGGNGPLIPGKSGMGMDTANTLSASSSLV